MSTITLPTTFKPRACRLESIVNQRVNASPFGGSEQVVDMLNDRWLMHCEISARTWADAAAIEALIVALRGQVNVTPLWHFTRPAPRGTMRGTLTLSTSAAAGAASLSVTGGAGQAGTTLLAGDIIGLGGQLLMVAADVTANGSGVSTVTLANRLRVAQSSAAAVTWDKPTSLFRLQATSGVSFVPGASAPVSFDFAEAV